MLVLSRKEGEGLTIGDNITVVITKVSGNRVTIGIEAPRDVKVVRTELSPETADEKIAVISESADRVSEGLKIFARSVKAKTLRNVG